MLDIIHLPLSTVHVRYDLIQCIRAYSFAPVRVSSSVCLHMQGSRLRVIVRRQSEDDIGSVTTYSVAAALNNQTDFHHTYLQKELTINK